MNESAENDRFRREIRGEKMKKAALALAISVILFVGLAVGTAIFGVRSNGASDLGYALDESVCRLAEGENGEFVAGTSDGRLFAFKEGQKLWEVGPLSNDKVLDIQVSGGDVYAVLAPYYAVYFSEADAAEAYAQAPQTPENAQKPDFVTRFDTNNLGTYGTVYNTRIHVVEAGRFFIVGAFTVNQLEYSVMLFDKADPGNFGTKINKRPFFGASVSSVYDGQTLYYAWKNKVYAYDGNKETTLFDELTTDVQAIALAPNGLCVYDQKSNLVYLDKTEGGWQVGRTVSLGLNTKMDTAVGSGSVMYAQLSNGGFACMSAKDGRTVYKIGADISFGLAYWSENGILMSDTRAEGNEGYKYYVDGYARRVPAYTALAWTMGVLAVLALAAAVVSFLCFKRENAVKLKNTVIAAGRDVKKNYSIYLYMIIPFALLITFYYIPIGLGFSVSFMDYLPGDHGWFVGFEHYKLILVQNPAFWRSALNMLIFLVADLLKALIPPIFFAECILAVKFKRFSLWARILLFLPGILPGVATTLLWQTGIFGGDKTAVLNAFIGLFVPGFAKNWLYGEAASAIPSIIAFGFPWIGAYLIFYGALTGIDASIYEASKLDGAGWWRRMISLDIPLIVPQIKYVFITSFIASAQNYGTLYILYGVEDAVTTPALLMYREIAQTNYGYACAMGMIIFLFLAVATVINFRMQNKDNEI